MTTNIFFILTPDCESFRDAIHSLVAGNSLQFLPKES